MEGNAAATGGVVKQPLPLPEKSLTMIPPDEERCSRTDGVRWRCAKFRMNLGVSNDYGFDTKYCENHYNFFKKRYKKQQLNRSKKKQQIKNKNQQQQKKLEKKISGREDDDDFSSSGTETWDSNSSEWRHRMGIEPTTNDTISDIGGGSANVGTKTEKKMLPSDEQRCGRTSGGGIGWRCKNFRMGHGCDDSVLKSGLCEKHYHLRAKYYENLKKRSRDDEGAVPKQGATVDDTSVTIIGDGTTATNKRKRENIEITKDDRFIDYTHGESEDFYGYVDSENCVGDLRDMMGMENSNWNKDEMKWMSEADMLSCFEEDPSLLYL